MDNFITLPENECRRFYIEAEGILGLSPASIEKDFWICWTLRELFGLPDWGSQLVFKGGTSLSKAWKLIERFSEDIDVVINREHLGFGGDAAPEKATSNKQRDRRLEELKTTCRKHIRESIKPVLTARMHELLPFSSAWKLENDPSDSDDQTLLFEYPSVFGVSGYIRPVVKIEFGARSDTEPSEHPGIEPYLAGAFPGVLESCVFTVQTVTPERTFWEKAMLLHEETWRPPEHSPKSRLARHYYDLWCLLTKGVGERAAANLDLFNCIATHRAVFFRKKKEAQESLRPGSLRIVPRNEHLPAWKSDYEAMRETMFFGETPTFEEILCVAAEFEQKFNKSQYL